MNFFDVHCHLHDRRLAVMLPAVLERSRNAGLRGFLVCGTGPDDWPAVDALAQANFDIVPAFGVHPWYVKNAGSDWEPELERFLDSSPALVGEIGLDRALEERHDGEQEKVFARQVELACERGLPMNLHLRKAWERLFFILKPHRGRLPPFILHSYAGTPELVPTLADWGAWFSFSGSVTRPRALRAHAAARAVPSERLLLETDAPDIPPFADGRIDYDTPTEPAGISLTAQALAALRGVSTEEIARVAYENSLRLLAPILEKRNFHG